jgi:electron transfer flavoprotein alpha subunit
MPNHEILVWSDKSQIARELLGKARAIADPLGWKVSVLAAGAADWGQAGAIGQAQPAVVLVGASKLGLEVAPRAAERTGAGYAAWMIDFVADGPHGVAARCMMYSGVGMAAYEFKPGTVILASAGGVFAPYAGPARAAQTVALPATNEAPRLTIIENHPKAAKGASLEDARVVLDVGQGVKERADLALVQSLAAVLDGQIGCSRPVASDRDWFPDWLGLSGQKVKPEMCLTLGVSGAIQHIIGIRDSRLIVAVNLDEGAPIFGQSDYGVVADLYAFIPVLMERIKARGIRPAWKS